MTLLAIKYWRELAIIVLLATCGILVKIKTGTPPGTTSITETASEDKKSKTDTTSQKITTIVKKPDGTTETIIKEDVKKTQETDAKSDKSSVSVVSKLSKYSLNVMYRFDHLPTGAGDFDYHNTHIDVGYRIGDLPFNITGGVNLWEQALLVGFRVDL